MKAREPPEEPGEVKAEAVAVAEGEGVGLPEAEAEGACARVACRKRAARKSSAVVEEGMSTKCINTQAQPLSPLPFSCSHLS